MKTVESTPSPNRPLTPSAFAMPSILLAACVLALPATATRADDPDNCLLCHQFRGLARFDRDQGRVHLFFTDPEHTRRRLGPHARLACTDCHDRDKVLVIPHAPVPPVDCTQQCHLRNPTGLERVFTHGNIEAMLGRSVHTPGTLANTQFQDGPLLAPGQSVCLLCHDEPVFRDPSLAIPGFATLAPRVFDRCDTCHAEMVSADIEYYVRHIASRFQPARPPLAIAQVCAVCHSDPKVLEDTGVHDAVASYVRSFHGKAALLGDETTADCLSCHVAAGENVHLMLAADNPRSSVHPGNVADSCRSAACHPGADVRIADAGVHLDLPSARGTVEFALAALFIVLTVLTFGPSAALVLLDLLQVLVGRRADGAHRARRLTQRVLAHPTGRRRLIRFTPRHRIEHWILAVLFIALVLTGFPLKFAETSWARALIHMFGGLQVARTVHHWAGIALVAGFFLHMVEVLLSFVRQARQLERDGTDKSWRRAWNAMPMWITPQDVRKTFQLLAYLLFLRKTRPSFGRFSPTEKFEYLGVFWGTMLLGLTGMLLWGEQISTRFLGGRAVNIATIAHTYEAFLALIHVGILHIYNVILAPRVFPLSAATITGTTPEDKLAEEHGEFVEEVARDLGIELEAPDTAASTETEVGGATT